MRRRVEEREPTRLWNGVRITVGIRQRDRGYRPPRHFEWNGAVEPLSAPDGERGVGHGDVQDRKEPVVVGHGQVVGACHLVRGLIPVSAGGALTAAKAANKTAAHDNVFESFIERSSSYLIRASTQKTRAA